MNDIKVITSFDEGNTINIIYKSLEDGKKKLRKINNFNWHFAIYATDYDDEAIRIFRNYPKTVKNIEKTGNYYKVFCDKNNYKVERKDNFFNLITSLKSIGVLPLETDLSMYKRFLIDKKLEMDENIDLLYFDIETDDTLKTIEIGRDKILSFAASDKKGNVYFEHGKEKEVLDKFLQLVKEYDAICGWNSRDFDLPYIKARLEKHGIQYNWNKRIHVDLMRRLIKLFSPIMGILGLSGFSLDEVGKVFANHQKIKFDGSIINLYKNNFDTFREYNINDVLLTKKIDEKTKATDLMIKECKWTGTLLNHFYVGELLDNYILREAHKSNIYMPSRPAFSEKEKNANIFIRGGFVRKPIVGVYNNVRVKDFKSLYPSVIVGWNIGIDSLNEELSKKGDIDFNKYLEEKNKKIEEIEFSEWYKFLKEEKKKLDPEDLHFQTANNNFFRRDVNSFISVLVKKLLEQRKEYKKKMDELEIGTRDYNSARATQEVIKEMSNSMYGVTADKNSRYFNKNVAESITLTGQFLNKTVTYIAKRIGYTTIYSDTDSIFLVIDDDEKAVYSCNEINRVLKNFLEKKLKLRDNIVYLEYEKKFRRMIMLDKKRYVGVLSWMDGKKIDKFFSRGTEDIKKNTTPLARKKFLELINLIINEEKDLIFIKKWLADLKEYVLTSDEIKPEDIVITTKISKPINSYKNKPIHVRLAEEQIKKGLMLDSKEEKNSWSNRIFYIVTNSKNKSESVLLENFNGEWDREYYWDVQIYAPLERVLKVVWPEENWNEHNIVFMEKIERKKEREEKKEKKRIETEEKKAIKKKEKESKTKQKEKKQLNLF